MVKTVKSATAYKKEVEMHDIIDKAIDKNLKLVETNKKSNLITAVMKDAKGKFTQTEATQFIEMRLKEYKVWGRLR